MDTLINVPKRIEAERYARKHRFSVDHGTRGRPSYTGLFQKPDEEYLMRNADAGAEIESRDRSRRIHPKVMQVSAVPYSEENWRRFQGEEIEVDPRGELDERDWEDLLDTMDACFDAVERLEARHEMEVEEQIAETFRAEEGRARVMDFFAKAMAYESTIESDDELATSAMAVAITPEQMLYNRRRGYGEGRRIDHGTRGRNETGKRHWAVVEDKLQYRSAQPPKNDRLLSLATESGEDYGSEADIGDVLYAMDAEARKRASEWLRQTNARLEKQKRQRKSMGWEEDTAVSDLVFDREMERGVDGVWRQRTTLTEAEAIRLGRESKKQRNFGRNR